MKYVNSTLKIDRASLSPLLLQKLTFAPKTVADAPAMKNKSSPASGVIVDAATASRSSEMPVKKRIKKLRAEA